MMIFEHDSYLGWLKEAMQQKQEKDPTFSGNKFSQNLGISQAYLSAILNNKKPLTEKTSVIIGRGFNLTDLEQKYLSLLVKKEKTGDREYKKYLDAEIQNFRKVHKLGEKEIGNFKVISDWHFSALLEMVNLTGIKHDPENFARKLGLSAKVVAEALQKLVDLEFLKLKDGRYLRNDPGFLAPPSEIVDFGVRKFHKEMAQKACLAIDNQKVSDRHISGLTMAIDPTMLPLAKKKIEDFKREISEILETGNKTQVFQFSVHLFRLDGNDE